MSTLTRLTRAAHPRTAARRPAGFTLVEMIVAVALLLLVMGMASTVFKVTLEGSGRLQQLSEIDRAIRMFKNTLARELGAIDPQHSVLAIQGNAVPAYWTHDQFQADNGPSTGGACFSGDANPRNGLACAGSDFPRDPDRENPTLGYAPLEPGMGFDPVASDDFQPRLPRADILLFIANLPEARSFVNPAVRSDGPVMIVYNHPELRNDEDRWRLIPTLTRSAALGQGDPKRSQVIASDWHLSRRATLLKEAPMAATGPDDVPGRLLSPTNPQGNDYLHNDTYQGINEKVTAAPPDVRPEEWDALRRVAMGEVDYVAPCGPPPHSDPICLDLGMTVQPFDFRYEVSERFFGGSLDAQNPAAQIPGAVRVPWNANPPTFSRGGLPAFWLMRSQLDPTPTAENASSLSQYFLPHCASFKVEWTPNDVRLDRAGLPEVVWIDPFKEPDTLPAIQALTTTATKPAHLSEFDILTQKMSPEPGITMDNHSVFGSGGSYPNHPLAEVQRDLGPRFGLPPYPVPIDQFQLNVYDDEPQSPGTVEPSFNTHVWFARDLALDANGTPFTLDEPDPMWPKALRITIDLYDDTGQFETPVRHVFIVPLGAQGDPKRKLS